jgi:protein-S-isoprenylcysteine O-methyltransferase Ste14
MELFPELGLGWLNGWILLILYGLTFGTVMRIFPKDVVARLYDRSGWSQTQKRLTAIGKLFALALFILITFTPLKVGETVFVLGSILFVLGLVGVVIALFNFRDAPLDQPVAKGLYKISRNPQWMMLIVLFLGVCIAIGSWVALLMLAIGVLFYHFRILAEERSCLAQYGESYQRYVERRPRYFLFF